MKKKTPKPARFRAALLAVAVFLLFPLFVFSQSNPFKEAVGPDVYWIPQVGQFVEAGGVIVWVVHVPNVWQPDKIYDVQDDFGAFPGSNYLTGLQAPNVNPQDPRGIPVVTWAAGPPPSFHVSNWYIPTTWEGTIAFVTRVNPNTPDSTQMCNQANISNNMGQQTQTGTSRQTGPAQTCVSTPIPPPVQVYKAVQDLNGPPVAIGDILRYTVTVNVVGGLPPGGVGFSYKDPLPAGMGFSAIDDCYDYNGSAATCLYAPVANQISVGASKLYGGLTDELLVQYDLKVECLKPDPTEGQKVCNQGTINVTMVGNVLTDSTPDTEPPPYEKTCLPICVPDFGSLKKTVVDTTSQNFQRGDILEYTITYANNGCADAPGTTITDTIDQANLGTIVPASGGTFAGGVITWNLGNVAVGQQGSVTFRATITGRNGDEFCNAAQITTAFYQGLANCNWASDPVCRTIGELAPADLHASKTMVDANGGVLSPGDRVDFVIHIQNSGGEAATNVTVQDVMIVSFENINAPNSTINGNTINWNQTTDARLASIAGGASVDLTFSATVLCRAPEGREVCNNAWTATSTETGNVTDLISPACLTVHTPDFAASGKAVDPASLPAHAGSQIHYLFSICNQSNGSGTNVKVTDTLDSNLDQSAIAVTPAPPATYVVAGNVITWTIPTLGPGTPTIPTCFPLDFTVNVGASVPENVTIHNTAVVTSDEWIPCTKDYTTNDASFVTVTAVTNQLLRNHCAALNPPCNIGALFPLPVNQNLPAAPGAYDDTGILNDTTKPLVFYSVTNPARPNGVKLEKVRATNAVRINY
jgi:uncharacterized repeat protein (TIGR01451 family)